MNDPLFLEDSFGKPGRVLPAFTEEEIHERKRVHVVFKCKEDEYEDIGVANSDLWKRSRMSLGHAFIWKKARPSRDSVLEFWSSETSSAEREIVYICISAFKKVVLTICW